MNQDNLAKVNDLKVIKVDSTALPNIHPIPVAVPPMANQRFIINQPMTYPQPLLLQPRPPTMMIPVQNPNTTNLPVAPKFNSCQVCKLRIQETEAKSFCNLGCKLWIHFQCNRYVGGGLDYMNIYMMCNICIPKYYQMAYLNFMRYSSIYANTYNQYMNFHSIPVVSSNQTCVKCKQQGAMNNPLVTCKNVSCKRLFHHRCAGVDNKLVAPMSFPGLTNLMCTDCTKNLNQTINPSSPISTSIINTNPSPKSYGQTVPPVLFDYSPIIYVEIEKTNGEWQKVIALLDRGASTTFIRHNLASSGNFKRTGGKRYSNFNVVGGGTHIEETEEFILKIRPVVKDGEYDNKTYNIHAQTINMPCSPMPPMDPETFSKYKHLKHARNYVPLQGGIVDILIGRNAEPLIITRKILQGEDEDTPMLAKSLLGYTIIGTGNSCQTEANCTRPEIFHKLEATTSPPKRIKKENMNTDIREEDQSNVVSSSSSSFEDDFVSSSSSSEDIPLPKSKLRCKKLRDLKSKRLSRK